MKIKIYVRDLHAPPPPRRTPRTRAHNSKISRKNEKKFHRERLARFARASRSRSRRWSFDSSPRSHARIGAAGKAGRFVKQIRPVIRKLGLSEKSADRLAGLDLQRERERGGGTRVSCDMRHLKRKNRSPADPRREGEGGTGEGRAQRAFGVKNFEGNEGRLVVPSKPPSLEQSQPSFGPSFILRPPPPLSRLLPHYGAINKLNQREIE